MACGCLDCTDITVPTGATGATGPAGPAGSNGTNGTAGVALLTNQYPNLATLGVAYESLAEGRTPYVLAANTLSTNGDAIEINGVFKATGAAPTSLNQRIRITFNGSSLNVFTYNFGGGLLFINLNIKLTRVSNTTAKYEVRGTRYGTFGLYIDSFYEGVVSLAGLNFTSTAYNIDPQGDSVVIGDIICTSFDIKKYKI
jgi:hypothetical protein